MPGWSPSAHTDPDRASPGWMRVDTDYVKEDVDMSSCFLRPIGILPTCWILCPSPRPGPLVFPVRHINL